MNPHKATLQMVRYYAGRHNDLKHPFKEQEKTRKPRPITQAEQLGWKSNIYIKKTLK